MHGCRTHPLTTDKVHREGYSMTLTYMICMGFVVLKVIENNNDDDDDDDKWN